MSLPLYYAVRITSKSGNITRRITRVLSVEELRNELNIAYDVEATVETKFLGHGEPIYKSSGPLLRKFHTQEQLKSYEAGLMGHGLYPLDHGPLDNFNYLGEQDAEILWDCKHGILEGDDE